MRKADMALFNSNFENRTRVDLRTASQHKGDESIFKNRTFFSLQAYGRKCISFLKWRPDVGWRLLFIVVLVLGNGCHGYQEQRFAMEPQDQSAILGSRVTLPCRVENKAGSLQWTKDDFGLGTHRNLSGYERYKMIGSDEEGDYSLDIRNISLEDDGLYQCQVSSGLNGQPGIRSKYAQLTVLIAPEPPRISNGAFIDATEDQPVDIECVSVGGKPAAEITWVDGNQAVIKKGVDNNIELLPDGQRYITRSTLRLRPGIEHHNQTLTCQAQNTADRAYRMATVHIEVKYAPKISIVVISDNEDERIPERTEARIGCEVDANPPPKNYNWYINNKPVIGDYDEEMIIFNVSRKLNGAIVKCEVNNSVGTSSETKTLEVTYPPSFKSKPKNIEADKGDTVNLHCDVDGFPEPEIRWLLYEPGRIGVKGKAANLKISVNSDTAGRYLCKATVEGYPEIEAQANIFIKGTPKIISNRTQFGMEGERVTIECAALSVPKPDDISWFFEGREISVVYDQDYAILEEALPDGIVKTSLVIRSSHTRHFGLYNCSVTNEYGNANAGILLKAHKTLPLLIILVGATSGIVLLSALVILLVFCHRRRKKNNERHNEKPDVTVTTSDMYKESDRSSNISDLKVPHPDGGYELEYTSSDHTGSTMKLAGLPLAGPVPLPNMRHDDTLMQFRYSNDYSDPMFADSYMKAPGYLSYAEYTADYPPPPGLRVQSPHLDVPPNRSLQGSLTRSIDTASTLPLSGGNSQNNSLQRSAKPQEETDAINNLGLPEGPQPPVYAQPNIKGSLHNGGMLPSGLDVRFAATYGNPYLRANSMGIGGQVHSAKPAATPAPPPYSAIRNSVVVTPGSGNQPSQGTHV